MNSNEIRRRFLAFFEGKGHTIVPSDLLVPADDPTLLFTSAGMNQFKEQFMGRNITCKRAASCQKCLRTADVEKVGETPRHHTFFEMLGNFSFGDYFKKEAIGWAWEFMTKDMSLPPERLWVSVYENDEESYSIWLNDVKVPADRIVKLGPGDNFWPQDAPTKGPNGPCGPCSEIFFDWGSSAGCGAPSCDPSCECGRFVEVWNLVFTEFDRKSGGELESLPNKNIDTGMGLERIASVMQGVKTNFETDLFDPIVKAIQRKLEEARGKTRREDAYLIADHVRAAVFAIADGVSPSNERRGYVVRKLIRRAYLKNPEKRPFLYNLVPKVAGVMKGVYPEVEEKREHISAIIKEEEKRFGDTLEAAAPVLEEMVSGSPGALNGRQIFKLTDTYGLPVDVIAAEAGRRKVSLDMEGFEKLMSERKEESRKGSDISGEFIFRPDVFTDAPKPVFSAEMPLEASVGFILKDGKATDEISEGEHAEIITSPQSSVFYAAAGGQVGDTGAISKEGAVMEVLNTFATGGRKVMQVVAKKGSFRKGDRITVELDTGRKEKTAKNHTATHLLQAALRQVLGDHVRQSGSFVDDKRLRFDFTHMKKLSERELVKVEDTVNRWIAESISVSKEKKSLKEAKEEGALSFFGEKYGDTVRVVGIGDKSRELCGGVHVDNTRDIEVMKIVGESSVASGIRRIEALTSDNAKDWLRGTVRDFIDELRDISPDAGALVEKEINLYAGKIVRDEIDINGDTVRYFDMKIKPAFLKARGELEKAVKKKQKERETAVFEMTKQKADSFIEGSGAVAGVNYVSGIIEEVDIAILRKLSAYIEGKVGSGVIVLGGRKGDSAYLVCAVTPDVVKRGLNAGEMVRTAAKSISGSGGGRPSFAQAGGKNPEGLRKAVEEIKRIIEEKGSS